LPGAGVARGVDVGAGVAKLGGKSDSGAASAQVEHSASADPARMSAPLTTRPRAT
jgi:hypothetical protein